MAASYDTIWKPALISGDRFLRLFLSHTHHHKADLAKLKAALTTLGVAAFVAHQDISPTKEWQDVIDFALRSCDALVAWLSDEFHASAWTDQEVGLALGRDVLVIPVKVEIDPYGLIGRYQAVQGAGRAWSDLAGELAAILRTHERTEQMMAEVAVDRFYFSYSYEDARKNLGLIQQIPGRLWTPKMEDRVEAATVDNDQVYDANVRLGGPSVAAKATKLLEEL